MPEYLELKVDKFTFKVAQDRDYNRRGVWAVYENGLVRIGLSDYLQQRSGDVAFADVVPAGTQVTIGEEFAQVETIKVNLEVPSPVSGRIIEVNPKMELAPEAINLDPYGDGWLALVEPTGWESDRQRLLSPQDYYQAIKAEAEREAGSV